MATGPSHLALDAYFEDGDPRFVTELLQLGNSASIGAFAHRWIKDPRPELRMMLLDYLEQGMDRPHHQALVKRMFKAAEEARDHALMGRFLVACDRLVPKKVVRRNRYNWQLQGYIESETLEWGDVPFGSATEVPRRTRFTYRTRRYLQRRAWRYFRELGKSDPDAYRVAMVQTLAAYQDPNVSDVGAMLSAWGLMHALYRYSPVITQARSGWTVQAGEYFSTIQFAPSFPDVWKSDVEALFSLLGAAQSRTVRLFAIHQLRAHHTDAIARRPLASLVPLLESEDPEVAGFASELFESADGLDTLPLDGWRKLLAIKSATVLPAICRAFTSHVRAERVDDATALELIRTGPAPVGQLALTWLKERPVPDRAALEARLGLAETETRAVREPAVTWLVSVLETSDHRRANDARDLFDARFIDVRKTALAWVSRDDGLADDVMLWAAMTETPYNDVRAHLLAHLEELDVEPGAVRGVWASVLLAVHRGGRAKLRAARQIADRVVENPDEADALLPLLSIALRSLRRPERRSALAAIGRAAFLKPELRGAITTHLPGLELFDEEARA